MSIAIGRGTLPFQESAGTHERGALVAGGNALPPIMNMGYWGNGAVTAREARVTFVRELADRLPELHGRSVLEAGCGLGGAASLLATEYGAEVHAVNIAPAEIERARGYAAAQRLDDRVHFHVADATELPFADESFDAVFSLEAAHGFKDKPRFVREARRVLRPGGMVVLSDMTSTLGMPLARLLPEPGLDLVTAGAWRRIIEDAGFEVLEHRLLGSAVYPGYRRWLMLTAAERRRELLDSIPPTRGAARWLGVRHAQAWWLEFAANRSSAVAASALGLREYVLLLARLP
jgi:ubiquinone/menaquinone biosynthesis C-methylase UbiE